MAAGDSPVSICNIALIALGEDPIVSLSDNTKRAILCNARYDDVRRAVLRSQPWNSARKQVQLAASTTSPLFNYDNAYPLPNDFIRMYGLDTDLEESIYDIMADPASGKLTLYTDEGAPLNVTYIYDLQDCTQMDPLLVHTIGYQLAGELALPLTQSSERAQQVLNVMAAKLQIARMVDSQDNAPREWDTDILLRSRR